MSIKKFGAMGALVLCGMGLMFGGISAFDALNAQMAEEEPVSKEAETASPKKNEHSETPTGASEAHKRFDSWQGHWDAKFQVWNPGSEKAMEFESDTFRMLEKGGFFLNETRTVSNNPMGMNGESTHIYGYDAYAEEYFAFLYGEGAGTPFSYRGKYDEKKNALVLFGDWQMKRDGAVMADVKERMEIDDIKDGKQEVRVYGWGSFGGREYEEFLHIKITYTKDELEPMGPKYMERYMRDAKASDAHKRLAELAGNWDTTIQVTPEGMPPAEIKGITVFSTFMEDRYLDENFVPNQKSVKSPFYVPVKVVHGYDNAAENYQLMMYRQGGWNTDIELLNGKYDKDLKASVMYSRYYDAINERWVGIKYVHYDPVMKDGVETMRAEGFFDFESTKNWTPAWNTTYTR